MAHRTAEYLKEKFENGDIPSAEDFSDLIDSCHNSSFSADVLYYNDIYNLYNSLNVKNIILKSASGAKFKLFLTEEKYLSGEKIADGYLLIDTENSTVSGGNSTGTNTISGIYITFPPENYVTFTISSSADSDGDGYTDVFELSSGTDINNANDFPISLFNVFNNI
jgi:hypothetical protein